jgi:hypothetical protein
VAGRRKLNRLASGRGYRFKDRSGTRKGRLIFIRVLGLNKHRQHIWEARCDCGATTETSTPHITLSCGCLQREIAAKTQKLKALPREEKLLHILANRKRQHLKRRTDPIRAMQHRLSRLHRHALKVVGAIKTSPTFEMLGYTPDDLVRHIERQFSDGMGWLNMSLWQIDHIRPVSEAKTEKDVIALNQLSNLRPMWAKENNRKKASRQTLL